MSKQPTLIVMLTYNDCTVMNAEEIFAQCRESQAEYWGFKEAPLPHSRMKELFREMKRCGKKTVLEVVAYTEAECLAGARAAVDCGCDMLMGTLFYDSVNALCRAHGIRYLPFVGDVFDRPSVLDGTADAMIEEAKRYLAKGAYGIDLLGYRFTGDASALIRSFLRGVDAPVCVAGSVRSMEQLAEIKALAPAAFTIGSAFFEHCFGGSFAEQINKVCDFMKEPAAALC